MMKGTMGRLIATGMLSVAFAASAVPAQAQQSEVAILRQQIEELQKRLDAIEAKAAAAPTPAPPPVQSGSKLPVTVSGLLQVHSLNYLNEDINNSGTQGRDTFRLRRGEIRLTAPAITSRISGTVMFDPAKTTSGRGTNVNIRERDNILQEIQISYLLAKGAKGSHFVDVGQYKIPVGYESLVSSSALPMVERALLFTQRDPFDGGYGDVRDTGIQLRGTFDQLDYRLGIFNGIGDRQSGLALSDAKAVLARLAFRPKAVQGLELGISGGRGNTGTSNIVAGNTITSRAHRSLLNFFAAYKKNKLNLQAEYLKGDSNPIVVGANTVAGRDIAGYYGHIGYMITPRLEGTFRYDYFDSNRDGDDADLTDLTLGLNYYIKGNNAKIQTNLVKRSSNDNAPAALRNDRLELRTNFQVAF